MSLQTLRLEAKKSIDQEGLMLDCSLNKLSGRGFLTERQEILFTAVALRYRPNSIGSLLSISPHTGKRPNQDTIRNVLNKEIYLVYRRLLNLPSYIAVDTVLSEILKRYSIPPRQCVSSDILGFEKLPNDGDLSRLETRAPQLINQMKSLVEQHKESNEKISDELMGQFDNLMSHADKLVKEADELRERGEDAHFKYRVALEYYLEALKINPLEKKLEKRSPWLRAIRCYVKLRFYG
jgi:hypothetical protein